MLIIGLHFGYCRRFPLVLSYTFRRSLSGLIIIKKKKQTTVLYCARYATHNSIRTLLTFSVKTRTRINYILCRSLQYYANRPYAIIIFIVMYDTLLNILFGYLHYVCAYSLRTRSRSCVRFNKTPLL